MGWPVAASQSCAVPSSTAGKDGLAVGAERRAPETALMLQRQTDGLASGRVPEPRRAVVTRGEDDPAVGTEHGRIDMAVMRQGRTDGLASGHVPEPRYVVRVDLGPHQHDLPIGLDRKRPRYGLEAADAAEGRAVRRSSHPRAVPCHLSEQVNTVLPSGLNATSEPRPPSCSGEPMLLPLAASQSCAVPSIAAGDHGAAIGAECRGRDGHRVRQDRFEPGVVRSPGGQVGPRGVLPGGIAGVDRRPPALDHPEQARADLALLEGGLAAVEVADRQETIRFGQRRPEAFAFLAEVEPQDRVISLAALACSVA